MAPQWPNGLAGRRAGEHDGDAKKVAARERLTKAKTLGVFTMEFSKSKPTPDNIPKEIIEERKKQDLALAT